MARKAIRQIYCWEKLIEEMTFLFASTANGGLLISVSLRNRINPINFFKKKFGNALLSKDEKANLPLINAVQASLLNMPLKTIPVFDVQFSSFREEVYTTIRKIPFGETRQYGEVASMINRKGAARAVGQAMKRNPFPIIFP